MRAALENLTDYRHSTVRSGVRWVLDELGADHPLLLVRVETHDKPWPAGQLWTNGLFSIEAWIPETPSGPSVLKPGRGSPPAFYPETWLEALICVMGHEAMHLLDHLAGKRLSEPRAEWAEYRLLRRWRGRRK